MRKKLIKDGNVYDKFGNLIKFGGQGLPNARHFAIVTKCGHCGRGYFVPILFNIEATDMETAIEIAMNTRRVKTGADQSVLCAFEIDIVLYRMLEEINYNDNYLMTRQKESNDLLEGVRERRILMPEIQNYLDKCEREGMPAYTSEYTIKYADDYPEELVLQRVFAPRRYGHKTIYPQNVKKEDFLDAYLYQKCIDLGIKKGKSSIVSMYYQCYGVDNPLGIKYKDGAMWVPIKGNKYLSYPLTDRARKYLEEFEKARIEQERLREETVAFTSSKPRERASAIEKFNKRLKKAEQYKKKQTEEEPPQPS